MKSVALHNLGCKVNAYELDVMRQMLQENGYQIVPFDQIADIYIINTCTVTNIADRKSRQMLHRAKKKNPSAVVVAVGCYVQNGIQTLEQDDCIDLAVGNNRKKDIVRILEEYFENKQPADTVIEIASTQEYEEMALCETSEHTRAYIKIQDGCNQFCTYCAIPLARGRVRSRKKENIIAEVTGLSQAGYREIVLTGIHLSSYGLDFLGIKSADYEDACKEGFLLDLIESLSEIPGIQRIRLSSLEPRIMTEDFVKRLSACEKICPHFHLSLQSGCDATLKRMNRHYLTAQFEEGVRLLRRAFERAAITTDIIVGFPGETEEEFAQTKEFLDRINFYEMHVFKYSRREGTPAAVMKEQVPDQVKARRSEELIAMDAEKSKQYRAACLGRELEILLEEEKTIDGVSYMVGHTKDYVLAAVLNEGVSSNQIISGTAQSFLTDDILLLKNHNNWGTIKKG